MRSRVSASAACDASCSFSSFFLSFSFLPSLFFSFSGQRVRQLSGLDARDQPASQRHHFAIGPVRGVRSLQKHAIVGLREREQHRAIHISQ